MRTMSEIAKNTLEKIRIRRRQDGRKKYYGIPTGISTLDRVSSGLKKGELVCIAARPAMGKTALASCIAAHLALREKKSVLIYSGEMYAECYLHRIISVYAGIPMLVLRDGNLDASEMELLEKTTDEIASSRLHINDTPGISSKQLFEDCIRTKKEDGLDLLIVDFLQLLFLEKPHERREEAINEIILSLKRLAQELDIPVIVLSQLSRDLEWRADHRPMLADFMEDCVPNIADTVWFLYRDAYYDKDSMDDSIMEVIVAKQYMGATSYHNLLWEQDFGRCSDYHFAGNDGGEWDDMIKRFLSRLQNLTGTDISDIDVEDPFLIKRICEHDMTGAFELGNSDIQILMEDRIPETFADLVKICAIAHGVDVCEDESNDGYEPCELEMEWAAEKMRYSVMAAWYKLNHPQEFYQAYFEIYVCNEE